MEQLYPGAAAAYLEDLEDEEEEAADPLAEAIAYDNIVAGCVDGPNDEDLPDR